MEVPIEVGNALEKDPKFGELINRLFEELKPEQVYFGTTKRWVIIITNAESQEELTKYILPIWHTFKTYPIVEPVGNLEEMKATLSKLGEFMKNL